MPTNSPNRIDKNYKNQSNNANLSMKSGLNDIFYYNNNRYLSLYSSIEDKVKALLQLDGGYETAFKGPDDKYARFPNLILMDNIEDKEMGEARSQIFQRQLVEVCGTIKDDYQLIYTTSMIAEALQGTLCVGPFYHLGDHTLDF